VKQTLKLAAMSMTLALCFGAARAQQTSTPKPEDAEKNAFQTPTTGKQGAAPASKDTKSDSNPESRLNDAPPANEKVGTSNTPGK
jgi:hypothetical protein